MNNFSLEKKSLLGKLLDYQDCIEICKINPVFLHKIEEVEGEKIHIFNYRLASYSDFEHPIENSDIKAYELRGLTFVEKDEDFKRYIMLHKFFNLGETLGYQYDDVKDKKIIRIQDKLDGSMIRFIRLHNGHIIPKTKFGVDNEQTKLVEKCLSYKLSDFIIETLDNNLAAVFELISPENRIVLDYRETKLVLVQLRDELTGRYLDLYDNDLIDDFEIETVQNFDIDNLTVEDLVEKSKCDKNVEGWVITLEGDQLIKIKTDWYKELHHLITEDLNRDDFIAISILKESIDDIIPKIESNEILEKIAFIKNILIMHLNKNIDEIYNIFKIFINGNNDFQNKETRKNFAIEHKKYKYFPIMMQLFNNLPDVSEQDIEEKIIEYLTNKEFSSLSSTKEFLKNELS